MQITKNGYLFVYCSNESNINVFFDNCKLTHLQGHLQQEDIYYPFGMGIMAMSSKAVNGLQNGYKYNGIVEEDNFDLNLYDAYYRTLDPQLGRWWQIYPAGGKYSSVTGYNAAFNNPVNFADPWGDDPGWLIKLANNLLGGARLPEVVITASRPGGSGSDLLRSFVTDDFLKGIGREAKMRAYYELNHLKGQIPFGSPGWTPPPQTAFITPYHPDLIDKWSESNSGLVRGTYSMIDNVYVFLGSLNPFKDNVLHLNGELANNNDRVNAFVGATSDVVTTVIGEKVATEAGALILGRFVGKIEEFKIPIYRVYGDGASMYGKSYSLINPKYVPFYRNFAGLPDVNSGRYLLKGFIPIKDIRVGRWIAAPLYGKTGGLPFELYQSYNQLLNPANIILKKPF